MRPLRRELWALIFSLLLGAIGVWLGTYDPLWTFLGIPGDLRGSLTITLTLFLLLSGFLVAFYFPHGAIQDELAALRRELSNELREATGSQPQMEVFAVVDGNQSLKCLCERVKTAKVVLNTRVTHGTSVYATTTRALSAWERALRAAIRSGTVFREVVSDGWQELGRERTAELAEARSVYEVSCVRCSMPSFLSFIVMQYADGSKEVWFGWIMSSAHAFEQACMRATERRVVQLFENWHAALFSGGTIVTSVVATTKPSEGT